MGANLPKHAFFALRAACYADGSAVKNESVAEIVRLRRVKNCAKLRFAFCRILRIGQAKQIRYTNTVGIANNRRLSVNIPHHEVRSLSAYSGQLNKLLNGIRHNATVIPNENFAGLRNVVGLRFVEPAGSNYVAYILLVRLRKRLQGRIFPEQNRSYHIDSGIRTLRRQARSNKQLVRLSVFKGANRIRIFLLEQLHRFCGTFFFIHIAPPNKGML